MLVNNLLFSRHQQKDPALSSTISLVYKYTNTLFVTQIHYLSHKYTIALFTTQIHYLVAISSTISLVLYVEIHKAFFVVAYMLCELSKQDIDYI